MTKPKTNKKQNLGKLSTTYQSPSRKLRVKNEGKTKHIQAVMQPKLERNIDAEIMIKGKAERFDIFWNNFKYEYKRESNQKNYRKQLIKEAEKVSKLTVPIDCLNKRGICSIGKIVETTALIMDRLLDKDAMWVPPTHTKSSIF